MGFIKEFFLNFRGRGIIYAIRKFLQHLLGMYEYDSQLEALHYFNNIFHDYSMIPPATDPDLRQMQICDAIQLAIFDKLCKKYNLRYWLDFGTLLGAVRHKGFIPWDDDMDVAMPKEDYDKMCNLLMSELGNYGFELGKTKWLGFGYRHSKTGIWLDIFPVKENVSKGTLSYEKYCKFDDVFSVEDIFPLRNVEFESYTFLSPNNIDRYLTLKYGNYMSLPKKDVLHHGSLSGRPPLYCWAKTNGIDMNEIKSELLKILNEI